jgi:hypothetical protein
MKTSPEKMALGFSASCLGVLALLIALALPNSPLLIQAEGTTVDVRFDYTNFPTREKAAANSAVTNYGCPYYFGGVKITPGDATTKSTFTGLCTPGSPFFWSGVAHGHWTGFTMLALEKCYYENTEYGVVKMWGYDASGGYIMSSDWIHYDEEYNYTISVDTVKILKIGFANGDYTKDVTTKMTGFILRYVC